MTPPTEGQEKDVLLVLDKQQGKVSAVKGIDKEGNLQTVPPTHGGEFMQVDKNSDVFSNFISNFYRKYQDTSGLELFSVKASEAERDAKAIEENHRNPTPEGDKRAEMLRVPKPDFHEFKQGYRFDPAKIDWENPVSYTNLIFLIVVECRQVVNVTDMLCQQCGCILIVRQLYQP